MEPITTGASTTTSTNLLQSAAVFMDEGGIYMWVILGVWALGVAIALERFKALTTYDVDGPSLMNLVKKYVLLNEVQKAIQVCSNSKALLPQILRGGLKRANQSKAQIQDAIEASMLELMPNLEKRMNYLGLVANISTLFGLLGTIVGLIESFGAVATADPASKAKLLALGIAKAMNTTALGLVSAISIMIIHSILASKSEKISSEIDSFAVKLVDLLGTKRTQGQEINNSETFDELPPTPIKTTEERAA